MSTATRWSTRSAGCGTSTSAFPAQPIKDAIAEQLDALPYYSTFRGTTNDAVIELSEELRDFFAPDGLTRAFYTSGGSDSVETALRLARQYHKIRGEAGRVKFLSLKKGYHGTHIGGASRQRQRQFPHRSTSRCCPAATTSPRPIPIATRSTRPIPETLARLCLHGAGGRDRLSGRRHHRRLHHGADPRAPAG